MRIKGLLLIASLTVMVVTAVAFIAFNALPRRLTPENYSLAMTCTSEQQFIDLLGEPTMRYCRDDGTPYAQWDEANRSLVAIFDEGGRAKGLQILESESFFAKYRRWLGL